MLSENKKRELLSFDEGELTLSSTFCKKNPNYLHESFILLQEVSKKELYTALFQFLKARPRSQWECEQKLEQKGFLQQEIQSGIEYFISKRWIDDEVFADFLIEGNQTYRPIGAFMLKQKLKEKRVSQDIISKALLKYQEEKSIVEDGLRLLRSQMYRFEKFENYKKQEKMKEYLYRRGFSQDDIKKIIKKL